MIKCCKRDTCVSVSPEDKILTGHPQVWDCIYTRFTMANGAPLPSTPQEWVWDVSVLAHFGEC